MIVHNEELLADGFVYRGEDHPGQLLYVCGNMEKNIQTHFIHVVIYGEQQWYDYLDMRDYLNANEKIAKEYSDLKVRLAKEYSEDRQAYTNGKSALIENILHNARAWKELIQTGDEND